MADDRAAGTDVRGKVIIVTGAAAGIGKVLTQGLLDAGARVLAVDLRSDLLRDLAVDADATALRVCAVDVTAPGSSEKIIDSAMGEFGSVFALVANAGIGKVAYTRDILHGAPVSWAVPRSMWPRFFAVNALAPIDLATQLLPRLLSAGTGRIVTVTTSLTSMLRAGAGPYGPSKAALEAFTSILSHELAGTAVTANVLVPGGPVDTGMVPTATETDRRILLSPTVMLEPLLWLLSDDGLRMNGIRIVAQHWKRGNPPTSQGAAIAPIGWNSVAPSSVMGHLSPGVA